MRPEVEVIASQAVGGKSGVQSRRVLAAAWGITLAVSLLPTIVWSALVGTPSPWLPFARIAFVVICLALSALWTGLRSLRSYLIVILALESVGWLTGRLSASALWQSVFPPSASFVVGMLGTQLLRLMVTLGIILVL